MTESERTGDPGEGCTRAAPESPAGLPPRSRVEVKHVILVLSGKGGVGKSTVAVNLAYSLAGRGRKVGLLDLDIHGPNIPKMLGIEGERPAVIGNRIEPVHATGNLSVISMGFFLADASTPVVWRGPMKMAAIRQFLDEVNWGHLDELVVDLPPGTGDEALTIAQLAPNLRGAVIVTTPQDVSVIDAVKAVKFVEKLEIPVLGIIENMSGMVCPHCGGAIDLFGTGGGRKAATDLHVPFLGAIPLDPALAEAGDRGRPFVARGGDSPTGKAVGAVMERLVEILES
ncbi:MAG TPA: Mrp/NBP35 family ATP-binding protein [Methanomicrobiales archaeon]|nr:Mrp/NBP35 family ATP-binding protein [Methanomicrobiales archaeon]